MTVPYAELDPGIREVVRWLNENGYETTDSGDGKTKFEAGDAPCCALDYPNVAIRLPADELVSGTDRLVALLSDKGIKAEPMGPEVVPGQVNLQAFYDPSLPGAFILLMGLDDQLLASG